MSKLDEQLAILQAAKEGKEIEVCLKNIGKWAKLHHSPGYAFDFRSHEYRVKKEPEILYRVEVLRLGEWSGWANFSRAPDADLYAENAMAYYRSDQVRIRKFVEVLDDED